MIYSATLLAIYAALLLPAANCKTLLAEVQELNGLSQPESPAVPSRQRGTTEGDAVYCLTAQATASYKQEVMHNLMQPFSWQAWPSVFLHYLLTPGPDFL